MRSALGKQGTPVFRPLPAQVAMLRMAHRMYCVTNRQICRRFYSDKSLAYVKRLLKPLVDHGLLHGRFLERVTRYGRPQTVYFLAPDGMKYLQESGGADTGNMRYRSSEINSLTSLFIRHTLAVNDMLIAAERLAADVPQVELWRVLHERELLAVLSSSKKTGTHSPVKPDLMLDIRIRHHPTDTATDRYPLAIEVDLDTESEDQWKRKITGYLDWLQNRSGSYYEFFGTSDLTVAVQTSSLQRLRFLLSWTEDILKQRQAFPYADMFYFTDASPMSVSPYHMYFGNQWSIPYHMTKDNEKSIYKQESVLSLDPLSH
jgi:hypothetical protein